MIHNFPPPLEAQKGLHTNNNSYRMSHTSQAIQKSTPESDSYMKAQLQPQYVILFIHIKFFWTTRQVLQCACVATTNTDYTNGPTLGRPNLL